MRLVQYWSDPSRWEWFAAGDADVAPQARSSPGNNSPQRLIFEIGIVFAVPLFLAAAVAVLFGA